MVVFGFIQSVEEYLTNEDLRKKYSFENVSYMYMRRSLFRHFRSVGTAGRKSNHGNDLPYEDTEDFLITEKNYAEDPFYNLEYLHMLETIKEYLTQEQQIILDGKIEGYSLKEIADINGIDLRRVYKQLAKVKNIVADTLDLDKAI